MFLSFLREPLRAPADEGGSGAAEAAAQPTPESNPAEGAPAAAERPQSVLDTPASDQKPADAAKDGEGETPKEGLKPKEGDETPEAKKEREAKEAETKKVETLKSYEALQLPEGIDPKSPMLDRFKDAAAAKGVSPEVAQDLINSVAPEIRAAVEGPILAWQKTQETEIAACKANKEFGGSDDVLKQNMAVARKGIDQVLGDPKQTDRLLTAMGMTGAGNFEVVALYMYRVGKLFSEGNPVGGRTAPTGKPKEISNLFYPPQAKEA